MRFMPGGWIPLLTADYLCGFFALAGLVAAASLLRLGRPVAGGLPSFGVVWRTLTLAATALVTFALVAQVSWMNVALVGARRWLVWRCSRRGSPGSSRRMPCSARVRRANTGPGRRQRRVLTTAALVAAVFTLRAPFFLVLLAPALVPMFLWLGLYGHWLRSRTTSPWPTACVWAALFAWLMAAVFPLV